MSSTEKRIYIFEKAPVRRAVLQQMLPTVAGQMVALLYNLADTFFVGLLNAPIQTAAVTVAYPPFLMMTAVTSAAPALCLTRWDAGIWTAHGASLPSPSG